jgi:hypothetical protein
MYLRQFIQSVLGLFFLVSSSLALSNTEFTYNVIDGGIEVTGCVDECPSDLVIPKEIDGYVVISIGHSAFAAVAPSPISIAESQLTSVTIPDSVISIGECAFCNSLLTVLDIPANVAYIGSMAFSGNQLTNLVIPDSVITIGGSAFGYNRLSTVIISNSILSLEDSTFEHNQLTSIIIPDSVTNMGIHTFAANPLKSVYFKGNKPEILSPFFDNPIEEIYFCPETIGWPGEPIEGITPQLDENCDNSTIQYSVLDIDQSGSVDALTDCLILLRYFFGLRGDNLTNGAVSLNANRATAQEIEAYIQSLLQWTI